MLSYQHIYHAGCHADVQKHAILAYLLSRLVKGDKPVFYMETHAGRGVYDLRSPEAKKTGEAQTGIMRVAGKEWPEEVNPYMRAVTAVKGEYPGSPMVAARMLRPEDKLYLAELHPQEYQALAFHLRKDKRIKTYERNGYDVMGDMSPPEGVRVLMVDPSYEVKEEYEQAAAFIKAVHKRRPDDILILWTPLLAAGRHEETLAGLEKSLGDKCWRQDIEFAEKGSVRGMYGSSMLIVNLPDGVADGLDMIGAWVQECCQIGTGENPVSIEEKKG